VSIDGSPKCGMDVKLCSISEIADPFSKFGLIIAVYYRIATRQPTAQKAQAK